MSNQKIRNALSVLVTSPATVAWLTEHDPKALAQAREALNVPVYMAVGANAWGLGDSIEAAKKQCRKHGARGERLSVYQLPEGVADAYVGELGVVQWRRPGHDSPGELRLVAGHDRRSQ